MHGDINIEMWEAKQGRKQISRTQSKPGEQILRWAVQVNKKRQELISSENIIQRHSKLTTFSLLCPWYGQVLCCLGLGWGQKISDLGGGPDYLSLGYGEHTVHTHVSDLPYPFTDCLSLHRWCWSPEFALEFFPGEWLNNQLISHIIPSLLSKAKSDGSNRRLAHGGRITFIRIEQKQFFL